MLTKAEIQRIRSLQEKKHREALGLFLIEGEKGVADLLASGFPLGEIYATPGWAGPRTREVTPAEMERISQLPSPSPVLGLGAISRPPLPSGGLDRGLTLALDGIQDPGKAMWLCDRLTRVRIAICVIWNLNQKTEPHTDRSHSTSQTPLLRLHVHV